MRLQLAGFRSEISTKTADAIRDGSGRLDKISDLAALGPLFTSPKAP